MRTRVRGVQQHDGVACRRETAAAAGHGKGHPLTSDRHHLDVRMDPILPHQHSHEGDIQNYYHGPVNIQLGELVVKPIPSAVRVRIPREMDDESFETCDADADVLVNIAAVEVEYENTDGVGARTYSRGGMVDD